MDIPEEKIAVATRDYVVFAFKEGTPDEIRQAKVRFNDLVNDAHQIVTKSALMAGFHRPTAGDFREEFIAQCRDIWSAQEHALMISSNFPIP